MFLAEEIFTAVRCAGAIYTIRIERITLHRPTCPMNWCQKYTSTLLSLLLRVPRAYLET